MQLSATISMKWEIKYEFQPNDKRINLGDTWACFDGKKVHAFFLQFQRNGEESAGSEVGAIVHAISEDMLHWEQLTTAVPVGNRGSYDDLDHWTGCTACKDGKYYIFYTSQISLTLIRIDAVLFQQL